MMWRLPRDAAQSAEYVGLPWKCPPSEWEIRKALTAQYRSTYRCDFMGMPQGRTGLLVQSCVSESMPEQLKSWHSSTQPGQNQTVIRFLSTACFPFVVQLVWQDMITLIVQKEDTHLSTAGMKCCLPLTQRWGTITAIQSESLNSTYATDSYRACCGIGTVKKKNDVNTVNSACNSPSQVISISSFSSVSCSSNCCAKAHPHPEEKTRYD